MRCALLSLLVAAVSCSTDSTIDIVFDPCAPLLLAAQAGANDDELGSIRSAAAMWDTRVGAQLTCEIADGVPTLPISFEKASPIFYGIYRDERGDIVINTEIHDDTARAVVIAHEIGHAFGLPHIEGRDSVMNPANTTVAPNAEDAAALAARWGQCAPAPGG